MARKGGTGSPGAGKGGSGSSSGSSGGGGGGGSSGGSSGGGGSGGGGGGSSSQSATVSQTGSEIGGVTITGTSEGATFSFLTTSAGQAFVSAPTEQTNVPGQNTSTGRPNPHGEAISTGPSGVTNVISSTWGPTFGGILTGVFGQPTQGAQNTNTGGVTEARDDTNPTPANENVLDNPVDPDPEIVVAADIPTYEVEQTEIADADYGLPQDHVSETDYGVSNHVDPALPGPYSWAVRAKEFYNDNKEHLVLAVAVAGVFVASGRLKKRGG
mgnify:CR=1 FL=1